MCRSAPLGILWSQRRRARGFWRAASRPFAARDSGVFGFWAGRIVARGRNRVAAVGISLRITVFIFVLFGAEDVTAKGWWTEGDLFVVGAFKFRGSGFQFGSSLQKSR